MGKAAKFGAGAALLALLLGGAAWWLLRDQDADVGAAARPTDAPIATSSDALAPTEPDAAVPLPLTGTDGTAAIAASAGDASSAPPGEAVTFTGRVLDRAGRPVKDAEVVHLPTTPQLQAAGLFGRPVKWMTPWDRFARATTDAQGRFTLPSRETAPLGGAIVELHGGNTQTFGSAAGRLPRLLVRHPAFETTLFTAWAFAHGADEVGDLVVDAGCAVTGRLVDEKGEPVAGAVASLSKADNPDPPMGAWELLWDHPRATSGDDGRFLLGGLWDTTLVVDLTTEGFVPQRKKVTLSPGATRDLGDVELSRGGEVAGWVTSATGEPIADAQVVLRREGMVGHMVAGPDTAAIAAFMQVWYGGDAYERHVRTDTDGAFHVRGVVPAESNPWGVTVAADGYEPASIGNVQPGGEALRFALQPAARILLRVLDRETKEPIANPVIYARRIAKFSEKDTWPLPMAVTAQGDAWLLVGAGDTRNEAVISAPGRATRGFVLPGVAPGAMLERTVELLRESVLAGRVVDEKGAPVPRARVRCEPPKELRVKVDPVSVVANGEGRFAFRALTHGDWSVVAEAAGFIPGEPLERTVKKEEHLEDVELVLVHGGRIAGRLLARDLSDVPGREVRAAPLEAAPEAGPAVAVLSAAAAKGDTKAKADEAKPIITAWKGVADDQGAYVIDSLPPGDYRVTAFPGAEGVAAVVAGAETRLDLALHERPRLRGRVTAAGRPIADATVTVSGDMPGHPGWGEERSTKTDVSGEYQFALDGVGAEYGSTIKARWKHAETPRSKVDPQWDREEIVDLAFGGGSIAGELVDEAGAPVHAQAHFVGKALQGLGESDAVNSSVDSDDAGKFLIDLLPSSRGQLMIFNAAYVGVTLKDIEVREGEITTIPRIVLRAGGRIEIRVGGAPDSNDWTKRFTIMVRSLAEPGWQRQSDVRWGRTDTMGGIPAGNVVIEVYRLGAGNKNELLRTVPAVIERGQTLVFEQPVPP